MISTQGKWPIPTTFEARAVNEHTMPLPGLPQAAVATLLPESWSGGTWAKARKQKLGLHVKIRCLSAQMGIVSNLVHLIQNEWLKEWILRRKLINERMNEPMDA